MFLTLIKKSPSDLLTRELKKMETEARQLEEMNPTPMPSCSVHNAPGMCLNTFLVLVYIILYRDISLMHLLNLFSSVSN